MVGAVHLVRHGTHDRVGRVLCGRMAGVGLGRDGHAEAATLARAFAGGGVTLVASSPMTRAVETAAPIAAACGLPVRIEAGLNEIDFGDWTGLSFDALSSDPRWPRWNEARAEGCPPGGEPMRAAQARAATAVNKLGEAAGSGEVVAVSHADVIKAVVCHVLGLSLDRHAAFEIEPASVTTVLLWPGGGKVVGLNDTGPSRHARMPDKAAA